MTDPPSEEQLLAWADGYLAGYESGYHVRVFEENSQWPPGPVFHMGKWWDQAAEREKYYEQTRRLLEQERGHGR